MSGRAYLGLILRQCVAGLDKLFTAGDTVWACPIAYGILTLVTCRPQADSLICKSMFSECYNVSEERIYIIALTKLPVRYPGYLLSRRLRCLQFLSQHAFLGRLLHLLMPFAASMGYSFMLHGPSGLHNSTKPEGLYIDHFISYRLFRFPFPFQV